MSLYDTKPPRVHAWMAGYYAAQIENRKGLEDIPFNQLSHSYRLELSKRAEKETRRFVAHLPNHKNKGKVD